MSESSSTAGHILTCPHCYVIGVDTIQECKFSGSKTLSISLDPTLNIVLVTKHNDIKLEIRG